MKRIFLGKHSAYVKYYVYLCIVKVKQQSQTY